MALAAYECRECIRGPCYAIDEKEDAPTDCIHAVVVDTGISSDWIIDPLLTALIFPKGAE